MPSIKCGMCKKEFEGEEPNVFIDGKPYGYLCENCYKQIKEG